MSEINRLAKLLFPEESGGHRVLDVKFFPGEQPVTVEEFCEDAHAAFVQVDSGQSEASTGFPETLKPVPLQRFLSTP